MQDAMSLFYEFYIITSSGTCIFSRTSSSKIDNGLLASIICVSKLFEDRTFHECNLGGLRYLISPVSGFLFVARPAINTGEDDIQKNLVKMQEIFCEQFSKNILKNGFALNDNDSKSLDKIYERFFCKTMKNELETLYVF